MKKVKFTQRQIEETKKALERTLRICNDGDASINSDIIERVYKKLNNVLPREKQSKYIDLG
jgi:Ca2+-binding EF-hand superfamily protein